MPAAEKITAETRTEFGKGAARRIRRDDKIPAVVYGHGNDPVHVTLPGHETMMALKHGGANALLELDIDGNEQLALTKQVQVDPIRRVLEHIDFVAVRRGEKVTVDVPIHVVGDAAPETLVVTENATVQVEAEATHIPEFIEVYDRGRRRSAPRSSPRTSSSRGHHAARRRRDCSSSTSPRQIAAEAARGRAGRGRGRGRHRARGADEEIAEAQAEAERRGRRATEGDRRRVTPPSDLLRGRARTGQRPGAFGAADRCEDADERPTCGWWSAWATPGRPTPGTGTTSATSSPTSWPTGWARRLPAPTSRAAPTSSRAGWARRAAGRASCSAAAALLHERVRRPGQGARHVLQGRRRTTIIAIHDELDIAFGTLRVKLGGGDNGHNGLRSMRSSLGTGDFYRVRAGIGRPPGRQDVADFVLSDYSTRRAQGAAVPGRPTPPTPSSR